MAPKTLLITGATDGVGLEVARRLASRGHHLLVHGRNQAKLASVREELQRVSGAGAVTTLQADLSDLHAVKGLVGEVKRAAERLDVVINNAGVLKTASPTTPSGLDVRFVVNTLAPYILTRGLLPLMPPTGRVINLSSAAQAPVSLDALAGRAPAGGDMEAYAQSKLALTMFSIHLGHTLHPPAPSILAVNPGSLLGTKMVQGGFGVAGNDIGIGADILVDCALSDGFAGQTGKYFDNDAGRFGQPHPDALNTDKVAVVMAAIDALVAGA